MKLSPTLVARLSRPRILWAFALSVSFLLSVFAAFRGGFVGPDYWVHLPRIIESSRIFDFSTTSPPIYYLFGHAVFLLIGNSNALPITLSIVQAAINTLAMWWFFLYSKRRLQSPIIHLALTFFLAFLPVRVIHATTIGTDSMTIPLFVLILFVFDRFRNDQISTPKNAALLGLSLALGVWTKYSFMGLLPAVFIIFTVISIKRAWRLERFIAICSLSLLLPSGLSLYGFGASAHTHGYMTAKHWRPKGVAPEMNYWDLFSIKASDAQLFLAPEYFRAPQFRAPQYFEHDIRVAHKHSYLALSHLSIFTDPMNLFQDLRVPPHLDITLIPDQKTRRPWKTPVMMASMSLGTLWTFLALIGTPWIFLAAIKNLWRDQLQSEDITAVLGMAYFLIIFLPIPFVDSGYRYGYWTPRLILPPLLFFFWAAFLLLDRKIARSSKRIALAALFLVAVQCAIEAVMLS
jgi:4-amino-4-deoxy-L-arabinose transferase-like glycosyltransferase